jgi:G3E family GTPase
LVGDFGTALKDALTKYSPERIIIEPSGVGKLSDVIKAVENIKHEVDIKLNSFVAVVDAGKCKMYMDNFGEFFNNQIENANTIVLSRSQKLSEEKLELCVSKIREHNSSANIITTNWEEIHGKQILLAMEKENSLEKELLTEAKEHQKHHHNEECCCDKELKHHAHHEGCGHNEHDHHDENCCCNNPEHGHHNHDHNEECHCNNPEHNHSENHECASGHEHKHHHADEVFTSWGVETPKKYSKAEIKDILKILAESLEYGVILRAKGIVPCADGGWINFDLVPGEYEVRDGVADYTGRLCVIGTNLNKAGIKQLFHI